MKQKKTKRATATNPVTVIGALGGMPILKNARSAAENYVCPCGELLPTADALPS